MRPFSLAIFSADLALPFARRPAEPATPEGGALRVVLPN
jgi:hypothetical protein